ncbi:MAG TPA: SPOR domain-containing protein [Burkholderiales bacterium]|jgi:DedD protein|nr:SPOR domain-containing protein [Burkholderiales bacterium]
MADNEDVNTLKRRGRRRLVGAIALVLLAVIVLPMVFDSEPKVTPPPVSVRVPGEDESGFTPKVTPKAPEEKGAETKAAETKAEKPPEKVAEKPPAPVEKPVIAKKEAEKPAAKPAASAAAAEKARAERALSGGGAQFAVQVGAFADPEKIKEVAGKLKGARVPFYTEQVPVAKGTLTRVRAGPFPSRDAAEASMKKLLELGLKGSKVVALS